MKAFLLVLVLTAAGAGAYYFYLRDHPISLVEGPELAAKAGNGPAPAGRKSFKELSIRLQGAMDRIPASLRDARQFPTDALDAKSRLTPYLQLHPEYGTIDQACDLIINADQAFLEHQQKCGLALLGPGASAQERARAAIPVGPTVYQQQQTIWDSQRRASDSKVRQLLATLENKAL